MGEIDLRIVLGLAIGGIPAVLVAAFLVREMPIETLRWLVTVVVLYAAAVMDILGYALPYSHQYFILDDYTVLQKKRSPMRIPFLFVWGLFQLLEYFRI
jgi:hypothetical protein